jgi:alkaline phosphatase
MIPSKRNFSKIIIRFLYYSIIVALVLSPKHSSVSIASPIPKNIIIMIGDGMGYNQSLVGSYYRFGKAGGQVYNDFPFRFADTTYSIEGWGYDPVLAWSDFNYVKTNYTDSAAAATAMATGIKTYNAGIGVDNNGHPVGNVFEAAEAIGKSTGVVTTVEFSHATPAGFVAHNISRDNYEQIANEMIYASNTDVIMGTGNPWFNNNGQPKVNPNIYKYVGGQTTWDALVAGTISPDVDSDGMPEPATLIQSRSEFQSLMTGSTPERVIGVAQVFSSLQQARSGDTMADPYIVPLNTNVPTLAEMSLAAINVLDNNPNGFALMVEGGAIDWAAHLNQPGRMIEEQVDFDQAVEAVVNWVETNSDWVESLLIVTGDHETGYLWGPGSNPAWQPLVNNGTGVLPGMQFNSTNHTNSLIAIYAKGEGVHWLESMTTGVDPIRGEYVDNTSIARLIFKDLSCCSIFLPMVVFPP